MITLLRTDSKHQHFIELVKLLDAYLAEKDGDEHSFYDQYNKIDHLNHVIVAYADNKAVACGAIKEFSPGLMEVKRMYTLPDFRSRGIAANVLHELEKWAHELKYTACILETGKRQTEAVNFYKKNRYTIIPNYGQYTNVENSVCFEKRLG